MRIVLFIAAKSAIVIHHVRPFQRIVVQSSFSSCDNLFADSMSFLFRLPRKLQTLLFSD